MRFEKCGSGNELMRLSVFLSFLALFLNISAVRPVFSIAAEKLAQPKIIVAPKKAGPGDILTVTVQKVRGPVEGSFNGKRLYFNDSKGSAMAVLGIDLYTEPGTYKLRIEASGKKFSRTVKISPKHYPTQRLTLPPEQVTLSPENEERVEREQKKLAAIWPVDSPRLWNGGFIAPLSGKEIGTPFGVRRIINNIPKNPHSGVDVSAEAGEPVLAPNDGVVILVDEQFFSGNSVIIDHGQGIYTMFFHLSRIDVQYGQAVMKGDVIGLVGSTGRSSGPHLHWGVRIQGARVDPQQLIRLKLE